MMKISKPVLMNDFMVSHVQFTSLNLVNFKNIKRVYDGNEKILLEYEHPSKVETSSRDWIGIFPRGWSNLQQYVTFEWISQSMPAGNIEQGKENDDLVRRTIAFCPKYHVDPNKENGDVVRRTIAFSPKYHINCVNQSAYYQFVYVGKQIEVLGVSSYFRFDLSCLNDSSPEIECLVPVTGKIRSTSVSDFGAISMANEPSSTSINSRKLIHTSSVHSLQNLDVDTKLSWSRMNFTDDKKNMCLMKRTSSALPAGDSLDPYSSHSEPVFPMSLPFTQCTKCYPFKRGGDLLRWQQALQSKLKIVMERNKVLEERAQEMKKELEKLQNDWKRMKMSYYKVNQEKVAYEKFVKDFIKSLEKDSIVRVMYGNTEILVKKVNYVGMEEHPRDKKTSKRERELKAVIGLQEITIRNLINSLQEKAKSVEELNQTVKLAQVFSAARTDTKELGMDAEESADEICNSDVTSEYDFSLAKPPPPEEVSGDADDVLDSIRRTSEMELKNIGITRSLGNSPDLDVTNLSVMTYESDSAVTKKPRLVDNVEDCWPFPRNPTKTLRQKLSEDSITAVEDKSIPNGDTGMKADETVDQISSEDVTEEKDAEATNCEDYYDAYDAFSVRSYSTEPEITMEDNESGEEQEKEMEKDEGSEAKEALEKALVPQGVGEGGDGTVKPSEDTPMTEAPLEKVNKFTCQLSIDFVQRRCQQAPAQERVLCGREPSKSEQNLVALRSADADDGREYTLERERSLITFKKSSKCLEIKITKVDRNENPGRSYHQKMVVQFTGERAGENERKSDVGPVSPRTEAQSNEEVDTGSNQGDSKSDVCPDEPYSVSDGKSIQKEEVAAVQQESEEVEDSKNTERMEVDAFSPRTEWNDASEILENEDQARSQEEEKEEEEVEAMRMGEEEPSPNSEEATGKMTVQLEKNKSEITEQFLKSKCNIQMLTEDSIKNLKVYQDSLRYEKNLQFLNSKIDGKAKEGNDEALKEKPSAILIQSGQAKVAVIRYQ